MQCPKCQHENAAADNFCEECGAKLATACAACGHGLKAAAKFCPRCGQAAAPLPGRAHRTPQEYTPKHLAQKILTSRAALEGERKTITALFADIKGSMELLEDLDPEDARRLIDPALQIMMDAVHRYEGYVAQSTGDGIFAMFGAPIAHEDHPQRALYAALLIQEEIAKYRDKLRAQGTAPIQIRVGVNTGEVVVRAIRTDDLHAEYTPVGHSTSLAARMEALATPGAIVASEATHRLTEGYFQFKDLGPTRIKGAAEPMRIYEVSGVGPLRTRLQAATRRGLTRFVGRRDEMEQMKRAMERAVAGHGQIVAVLGEAGVGKSRLVYEFKVPLETKYLVLESFSVSHGKAHAFLPLVELLKEYFRIRLGDDERKKREKIGGKVLMLDRALEDTLPYLFALLGVSEQASWLQQMDAQIRRQRTLDAVKRLLVRESMNQPLLLIFEDLHWIDGETQAFLDLLAEGIATARILLLVDYRPEYRHEWGGKTYYTQLRLDPLGRDEAAELLKALLGDGTQAAAAEGRKRLIELVMDKTEGNPFFMEEVVQMLAEERLLTGERGSYRLEKPVTELHVPTTVRGVLAARIDRLGGDEKDLLQTLAVIGKEFSAGLAYRVAARGEEEMHALLGHLQAAEFLYEQPAFPEPEYTFKHALTQEVAYQSVLAERRKQMHETTGRAIEELYAYRLSEHYGELAHHYGRSDNTSKAVEYLRLAGQQALERSAYEEAIDQLNKALELVGTLPESTERDQSELAVLTTLGTALIPMTGWTSKEVEQIFTRAYALCERIGDDTLLVVPLWGLTVLYGGRAELDKALELSRRLTDLAERIGDASALIVAHQSTGWVLEVIPEHESALQHFDETLRLYDPSKHQWMAGVYGVDPGICARIYKGALLGSMGFLDQALEMVHEGLRMAEELGHPLTLGNATGYLDFVHWMRRDFSKLKDTAAALMALSEEHGIIQYSAWAEADMGGALASCGHLDEGISRMRHGLSGLQTTGVGFAAGWVAWLGEFHGLQGEHERGLELVAEALEQIEATGARADESFILNSKGNLLLAASPENEVEAEQCFQTAVEIARSQKSKVYELIAVVSLARLWRRQGKKEEARRILSDIYGSFTEGFDTATLREAKALLDELA